MHLHCRLLFLILVFFSFFGTSKATDLVLRYGQIPAEGILLWRGWKYMPGDQPEWADPGWDDNDWKSIDPTRDIHDLPALWQHEIVWLRLNLSADSLLAFEPLALFIEQTGASEIYMNGELIGKYGHFRSQHSGVKAASPPSGEFIIFPADTSQHQVLAVRFAIQKNIHYINFFGRLNRALAFRALEIKSVSSFIRNNHLFFWEYLTGIMLIMALLHISLFFYTPRRRANLHLSIFYTVGLLGFFLHSLIYQFVHFTSVRMFLVAGSSLFYYSSYFIFLLSIYSIFRRRPGITFMLLTMAYFISVMLNIFLYKSGWLFGSLIFPLLVFIESLRIAYLKGRKQFRGARFVTFGIAIFIFFHSIFWLMSFGLLPSGPHWVLGHLAFNLGYLALPVSLSFLLATETSYTIRSLDEKLVEVRQLSAEVSFREQEKLHLQKLDEFKSQFFTNLSHEFRTPLSIIMGTAEKLRRTDDQSTERQKDYHAIDHSAGNLLQMINQLLDLSRLESGIITLKPQPADISKFLKQIGESFSGFFESKRITFRFTHPLQPLWVKMDKEKLEQIINNLLSNAAKFTPEGGEVSLTSTLQAGGTRKCCLVIQVQDNGIGISRSHLPHIFDRFYQADTSATRQHEGTGIGLALARELVKLHGGDIGVESTEGKGSTFTVNIPIDLADAPDPGLQNSSSGSVHSGAGVPVIENEKVELSPVEKAGHSGTILVIDDNADLRHFIASYLANNFMICEAENGRDGFVIATETMPDLIISDIMMPFVDGVDLCLMLKEDHRTSHIPVILLTAKADTESKVSGLESGADDYLVKPFSAEELLQRVKNLIRQRDKLKALFSRKFSLEPAEIELIPAGEKFLHQVLTIMEENMDNPAFDINNFGRALGMSRSGLNRKLTAMTGQTPNEFIRAMRMKRAAQLLNNHHGTISEVSYMVGFNSTNYFTKSFKAFHGVTPTEFLNKDEQANMP
jgi:signal transduction histidine kinase/DNA-binding response OmpR family regulator